MKYFISILFITLLGCTDTITQQELKHLNGYWDIDKVESVDKKVIEYGANSTIDYYFINEKNEWYRKKTTPDFSGTYQTNNIKDKITIIEIDGEFVIKTVTSLDTWKDIIITLTPEILVLKNEKGIIFSYKKHEKFNIN